MIKLRIGEIPYLNLVPIFHMLRQVSDCSHYEFVKGHPSELNEMLRSGTLDVSPSSSIEYLRRESDYTVIDGHSISSHGSVESILLFSRLPIAQLAGKTVYVTHHSETSAALLEIILRKFIKIDCKMKVTAIPSDRALSKHSAFLAIGDEALKAAHIASNISEECPETGCSFLRFGIFQYFVYDLGQIWHENTGLPFVFALWIARNNLPEEKRRLLKTLADDLDRAKKTALEKLGEISNLPGHIMPPADVLNYWKLISYDLGAEHRKGLALFRHYLDELGLLREA